MNSVEQLPLRLAVEPYLKSKLGYCVILPSHIETIVCFVLSNLPLGFDPTKDFISLNDAGRESSQEYSILLATNKKINTAMLSEYLGLSQEDLPKWCFSHIDQKWYCHDRSQNPKPMTKPLACKIIDAIYYYHSRQLLEPSIRGFLTLLERQFPRNDLYLFELLQNAIDDDATHISVRLLTENDHYFGSQKGSLLLKHNGNNFSPLDVVGLSSVGLNVKSAPGQSRKIGFMGVGFKAVYKRYAKVGVFDHIFSFQFKEMTLANDSLEAYYGWVMKPVWFEPDPAVIHYKDCDDISHSPAHARGWCHFLLEEPRDGLISIIHDLKNFPASVPPLIGRYSIMMRMHKDVTRELEDDDLRCDFRLDWHHINYNITRINTREVSAFEEYEVRITVNSSVSQPWSVISHEGRQKWVMLPVHFIPTKESCEAYESYTKRQWRSVDDMKPHSSHNDNADPSREETLLFFQVDAVTNNPILESSTECSSIGTHHAGNVLPLRYKSGNAHAILPTKLTLGCPLHWHASWILSTDRTEIQSIKENCWNNGILRQCSHLLILLLRWIASSRPQNLTHAYALLPVLTIESGTEKRQEHDAYSQPNGILHATVFHMTFPIPDLVSSLQNFDIIPVAVSVTHSDISDAASYSQCVKDQIIDFHKPSACIRLPVILLQYIPAITLLKWFGKYPLATTHLGEAADLALWKCSLDTPTPGLIDNRRRYFTIPIPSVDTCTVLTPARFQKYVETKLSFVINMLLFIGNHYHTDTANLTNANDDAPGFIQWPIFPSASMHPFIDSYSELRSNTFDETVLMIAHEIIWLDLEKYCQVPLPIRQMIRRAHIPRIRELYKAQMVTINNRQRNPVLCFLDDDIEDFFVSVMNGSAVEVTSEVFTVLCCILKQPMTPEADLTVIKHTIDMIRQVLRKYCSQVMQTYKICPLSVETLIQCYLDFQADRVGCKLLPRSDKLIEDLLILFDWIYSSDHSYRLTHLLVDVRTESSESNRFYRLESVNKLYLPHQHLSSTVKMDSPLSLLFNQPSLLYENRVHRKHASVRSSDGSVTTNLHQFFKRLGVHETIALKASLVPHENLRLEDGSCLILPKVRSTPPSNPLFLPYGLGRFNRKLHYAVDVYLTDEWVRLFGYLKELTSPIEDLNTFYDCVLTPIGQAFQQGFLDDDSNPNATSTPAMADAFNGKTIDDQYFVLTDYYTKLVEPELKLLLSTEAKSDTDGITKGSKHRLPPSSRDMPFPAFCRLYYLPPGQPGAADSRWVPGLIRGRNSNEKAQVTLFRPCEVILVTADGRSHNSLQHHCPIALLPHKIHKIFVDAPPIVHAVFRWGTVPISTLDEFGSSSVNAMLHTSSSVVNPHAMAFDLSKVKEEPTEVSWSLDRQPVDTRTNALSVNHDSSNVLTALSHNDSTGGACDEVAHNAVADAVQPNESPALPTETSSGKKNFGKRFLERFGYTEGIGLGKNVDGIVDPLILPGQVNRLGLGFNQERKRKIFGDMTSESQNGYGVDDDDYNRDEVSRHNLNRMLGLGHTYRSQPMHHWPSYDKKPRLDPDIKSEPSCSSYVPKPALECAWKLLRTIELLFVIDQESETNGSSAFTLSSELLPLSRRIISMMTFGNDARMGVGFSQYLSVDAVLHMNADQSSLKGLGTGLINDEGELVDLLYSIKEKLAHGSFNREIQMKIEHFSGGQDFIIDLIQQLVEVRMLRQSDSAH